MPHMPLNPHAVPPALMHAWAYVPATEMLTDASCDTANYIMFMGNIGTH